MKADPVQTQAMLQKSLDALDIGARAIVMPTPWDVGPVAAYLFASDPVTLIDAGVDSPEAREAMTAVLGAEGLTPTDVRRVIVTHAHLDHFGGAVWLQDAPEVAGARRVLLHADDIALADPATWGQNDEEIFRPLGFASDQLGAFFSGDFPRDMQAPIFTPMQDGDVFETGHARLRIEHHPGHSPGHVWVIEETSGVIFVGDYILADHPTNAGLELDRSHPTGRVPLLQMYNAGLRELRERETPAIFPAHGPPIQDHRTLIDRRLAKSHRRTRHVLEGIRQVGGGTALEIGRALYGSRPENSWEVMADLTGRLDLLVAEGRASALMGEDGAWHFSAPDEDADPTKEDLHD